MNARERKQRGFTLIEVLVVLLIAVALIAIAGGLYSSYAKGNAAQLAARHAATVRDAAAAYVADNYGPLLATSGPTTPTTITTATLAAGGYLPAAFNQTSPYGQGYLLKVIEPSPGKLQALVVTTGGDTISGVELRQAAALLGPEGGYIESTGGSATAVGANGGWVRPLAPYGGSPGLGKIAVAIFSAESPTSSDNGALHRAAVSGHPELNQMSTAIDMNGNAVAHVGTLDANTAVLPNGNSMRIGSSYLYGDSTNAAIRQAGGLYIQKTAGGAASIAQVADIAARGAVTVSGNLAASGDLSGANVYANESYANGWFRSTGNGGWYSAAHGGGWYMTDPTWIRVYNGKGVYTSGQFQGGALRSMSTITSDANVTAGANLAAGTDIAAGRNVGAGNNINAGRNVTSVNDVTAGARVTAGEFFKPGGAATCNASCSTNGLIGVTAAGAALSCVNGLWKGYGCAAGGPGGGGGPSGCPVCPSGGWVADASCPAWAPSGSCSVCTPMQPIWCI